MRQTLLRNPVFAMAAEQFDRVADFLDLSAFAKRHHLSHRTAAQAIAIQTVADAKSARGLFP
ncbi:MAG: hypothetical protein WCJ14_04340 [Verrucomicrobiota bacterium]